MNSRQNSAYTLTLQYIYFDDKECYLNHKKCQAALYTSQDLHSYRFAVDIFSEHRLLFQQLLLDPKASTKEISLFQNPFKCTTEELSLNL